MSESAWSSTGLARNCLARSQISMGRGDYAEALAAQEEASGHLRASMADLRAKAAAVAAVAARGPVMGSAVGAGGPLVDRCYVVGADGPMDPQAYVDAIATGRGTYVRDEDYEPLQ